MTMLSHQSETSEKMKTAQADIKVIALSELQEQPSPAARPLLHDTSPLHQVKARLQVCIGEVEMTVGDLLAAKEHQIVRLDKPIEHPIDLLLDGKVVARGQLVAVDDHFAVRITDLPVTLKI